jgi:probable phosphomutase (TIGR03848 family)
VMSTKLLVASIPVGLELIEELGAALRFVDLVDCSRAGAQPVEGAQEATVGLVGPAHVARAAPPRLAQPIEPAVVTDAVTGVRLDVVARELAQARPGVEEGRPPGGDRGDRGATRVLGLGQRGSERRHRVCGLGCEDRLGDAAGEVDGMLSHGTNVGLTGRPRTAPGTITFVVAKKAGAKRAEAKKTKKARKKRAGPAGTKLVLVRHAVTEQTGPMLTGRTPGVDLSEDGRRQAKALGERLADLPVKAVYASPIERTAQTAEAVAVHHGVEVRELPGVIEADYGEWTGGKLVELAKTDLWKTVQRAPSRARFPGGESLAEMQGRMVTALETVVADHAGEMVVVVSHADPIKAAIAHFTGLHLDLFQRVVVSPASVTVFELSPHGAALIKCNDTGDLEELRPPKKERKEAADG